MFNVIYTFWICLFIVCIASEATKNAETAQLAPKKPDDVPNTKFFDLGGIFNQLFPSFNQGNQGGPGGNPGGMGFPANSQYYPAASIQNPNSQGQTGVGPYPIVDDAQQYPNQGNFGGFPQAGYPNQGNLGGLPQTQYPNQGNFGGSPQTQYPNQGNFGGSPQTQYPNQGNFGGSPQTQYPNQGNFGGSPQMQYPNQGNLGGFPQIQYPNQGNFGGFPQSQFPNQGNLGGLPQTQYPNPGNLGVSPQTQYPNQGNFGGSPQTQYPNQGSTNPDYPNNIRPGEVGDGTLDGIMTPQEQQRPTWYPNQPDDIPPIQSPDSNTQTDPQYPADQQINDDDNDDGNDGDNNDGTVAILGSPVQVPTNTTPAGQIIFPTSTDSPAQKQCVQDCQSTSEYNPVCGTNNVTYINPGKFVCARNCGIRVYVAQQGRCPNDTPYPRNVLLNG